MLNLQKAGMESERKPTRFASWLPNSKSLTDLSGMSAPTFTTERLGDGTIKEFTITVEQPFFTVWDPVLAFLSLMFLYHYVRRVVVISSVSGSHVVYLSSSFSCARAARCAHTLGDVGDSDRAVLGILCPLRWYVYCCYCGIWPNGHVSGPRVCWRSKSWVSSCAQCTIRGAKPNASLISIGSSRSSLTKDFFVARSFFTSRFGKKASRV
jgi:hypothetical protein